MSNELIVDKENFIRLILSNIEFNSSTPERAKDYLISEGYQVETISISGMKKINALIEKTKQSQIDIQRQQIKATQKRIWDHISVTLLIQESGNTDPIDEIKSRARNLVLKAFELGWTGPPFNSIQLAKFLGIDVIPNDAVIDARIVPVKNNNIQIQYNPYQRPTRINFSVAHEIAHTLFSDCSHTIRNREETPVENRQLEQLCNAAAAEIQLPYAIFSNDANSLEPSIEALIDLAKKYHSSLESVFIRYTEVIDKPCAILIGIFQTDNRIVIDYHKSSRSFPISLPENIEIPDNSNVYECISPGWTSRGEVEWSFLGGKKYKIFSIGISPYRRDNKPRVGILILPVEHITVPVESGKVILEYGDATKPRGKGSKIIAQVVNTSASLGRGFGYSLAKNYPIVKEELKKWQTNKKQFILGNTNLIQVNENLFVFQMLAQKGLFATATEIPLRYNELRKCLVELRNKAIELDCSIHMPAIGAGQAKGNWEIIIGMIHDELVNYDLKVNIYLFPDKPLSQKSPSNITLFKEDSTWANGKLF